MLRKFVLLVQGYVNGCVAKQPLFVCLDSKIFIILQSGKLYP